MFSKAEVQPSRARLIIDCKEAPESEADLRHPKCRSAVLGHLEHEFGVESVILSHYVERQYGPRAMEALRRILALAGLLTQLGARPPAPNFPGTTKKQVVAALLFTTGYASTNVSSALSQTRFTWNHTPAGGTTINSGDRLIVEIWLHATAGAAGGTANDLVYIFQEVVGFGEACLQAGPPEEGAE